MRTRPRARGSTLPWSCASRPPPASAARRGTRDTRPQPLKRPWPPWPLAGAPPDSPGPPPRPRCARRGSAAAPPPSRRPPASNPRRGPPPPARRAPRGPFFQNRPTAPARTRRARARAAAARPAAPRPRRPIKLPSPRIFVLRPGPTRAAPFQRPPAAPRPRTARRAPRLVLYNARASATSSIKPARATSTAGRAPPRP